MKKILTLLRLFPSFIQSQNIWQLSNGPYTLGGSIECETFDNIGFLYVGTMDSGIYYSSDLGNQWSTSRLNGNTITSISSAQNGYIFATTYQLIFRSTDQGTNWVQITNGLLSVNLSQVKCSFQNSVFLATWEGLFRSIDYGNNWERIDSGFSSTNIKGVTICDNGDVYAYSNWSIYRSTNDGLNWMSLSGFPAGEISDLTSDESNNLFLTKNLTGVSVYYGYRSTDQGETWEQFGASCPLLFYFVWVSPEGNLFVQGQDGFFKSTDKGESWSQISTQTEIGCLSFYSNEIFLGGSFSSGVWKSTDGGNEWKVIGIPISYPRILSLATNSTGIVFAGGKGNYPEIYKTTNQGQEWFNINATFDGTIISTLELDEDDNLFAGSYGGGMYFSSDFGTTWVQRNSGLTDLHITTLKIHHPGDVFVGTSNGGIFRSTNNGIQWNSINQGLTVMRIEDIAIALFGNIYIGTIDGVFGSSDQGLNWTHLTNGWGQVISIAVNSQEYIFAENSGYGIYRSTDLGNSWTQVTTEIWSPIMDIFINSLDTIFTAGANGVFRSTNNGEDWTLFNSGLAEFNGTNVIISDINGKLIAGTEDRGVCWTTFSTTSMQKLEEKVTDFRLYQNYPNPFNPSTTIRYRITQLSFVSLIVYDAIGNEVATLVNKEESAGEYQVEFSSSNLSSGIYFYRIIAGNFEEVRKMLLLK